MLSFVTEGFGLWCLFLLFFVVNHVWVLFGLLNFVCFCVLLVLLVEFGFEFVGFCCDLFAYLFGLAMFVFCCWLAWVVSYLVGGCCIVSFVFGVVLFVVSLPGRGCYNLCLVVIVLSYLCLLLCYSLLCCLCICDFRWGLLAWVWWFCIVAGEFVSLVFTVFCCCMICFIVWFGCVVYLGVLSCWYLFLRFCDCLLLWFVLRYWLFLVTVWLELMSADVWFSSGQICCYWLLFITGVISFVLVVFASFLTWV